MFGISTTERGVGGSGPPKGDELPLDLQYDKAIDWLVGQRKVPRDWQRTLKAAQARLSAALALAEGRPELDALGALLATPEERFSYYEAAEVLEVLKGAGLAEKNFIGQYSNAYTAKWADAVRRYESGGVYLAEGAQRLVHQCTYELPALRKEVSRAEKELSELQRREAEYLRLAEAAQKRFEEACAKRKIGVCGRAEVRERLQLSLSQLRPLHLRAAALCQGEKVAAAAAFYRAFVRFCLEKAPADEPAKGKAKGAKAKASSPEETAAACLPTLSELQRLELPDDDDDAGAAAGGSGGGGGGSATGAAEIDWGGGGDDGGAGGGGAADIDWGGGGDDGAAAARPISTGAAARRRGDNGGGVAEIDWGGAFEIEEVAASAEGTASASSSTASGARRCSTTCSSSARSCAAAREMKSEGAAKGGCRSSCARRRRGGGGGGGRRGRRARRRARAPPRAAPRVGQVPRPPGGQPLPDGRPRGQDARPRRRAAGAEGGARPHRRRRDAQVPGGRRRDQAAQGPLRGLALGDPRRPRRQRDGGGARGAVK